MRRNVIALAVGLGSLSLSAQDRPVQPFRTEANYIRVDMYPTVGGRPVDDLQASEVEIADQGVPQKIDRFERIRRQGGQPQPAPRVEPPAVAAGAAPAADSHGRIFVLFLDSNHVDGNWGRGISQPQIGRASCRERVYIWVVAVACKQRTDNTAWVTPSDRGSGQPRTAQT